MKFSREIRTLLAEYSGRPLYLSTILKHSGEYSFGVMITLLTLPFLLPVPLVGISTLLNLASFLLGIQLGLGFHQPWLPRWLTRLHLSSAVSAGLLKNLDCLLHPLERLVRPRLEVFVRNSISWRLIGFCVAWCEALRALNLQITFTNKISALAMIFIDIGMVELDWMLICFGYSTVILTTLLFAELGSIIWEILGSLTKILTDYVNFL